MSETPVQWYLLPAERWRTKQWERDSQRQKLYDAESIARWKDRTLNKEISSIDAIQRYVNFLTTDSWFINIFGNHTIKVKEKKGWGASSRKCNHTIRFSTGCRNVLTILHEVAHQVHKSGYGSAHGRFYARTLIVLVEYKIGAVAVKVLKKEFRKRRVKYLPKRVLTDEAREKLRQSFKIRVLNKMKVEVLK